MHIRTTIVAAIASLTITGTGHGQTVADFFDEEFVMTAPDGSQLDLFGGSVAISGDTAMIGATRDDDNGSDTGSVYVFERNANNEWGSPSKLLATGGGPYDIWFGSSIAILGNTAVIGAEGDGIGGLGINSGSAFVFERNAEGAWIQVAKLNASNGEAFDRFGGAVAISGNTILIGAYDDDNFPYTSSGSAYIFERNSEGVWSETQILTASDGSNYGSFGFGLAIEGDTAIIGASTTSGGGTVYVFKKEVDGEWVEVAMLTASDAENLDNFGWSVALAGDTSMISAPSNDPNGCVYIFERDEEGAWSEFQKLIGSSEGQYFSFGSSVSTSSNCVVIGSHYDDDFGFGSGAAYVFQRELDGTWGEVIKLTASDADTTDYFGASVAISDGSIVLGASGNNLDTGSAYVTGMYNAINLDAFDEYGNPLKYVELSNATNEASPDDRLAVRSAAFDYDGIIDASSLSLDFIAVEPISMGPNLMFLPGNGTSFLDSDDVEEAGYSLFGSLLAPTASTLVFSNLELDAGGELIQNEAGLFVHGSLDNSAGTGYLSGNIFVDQGDVSTGESGINHVINDTLVLSDYTNAGTTVVHVGTLYIIGNLVNTGTMLGDVNTGPGLRGGDPPAPGDGFSIGGSSILGEDASLRMLDFDWTLGIGGDVDWAINDPARFQMSGATLSLTGLASGVQVVELMSADNGAVDNSDFEIGTLRVEPGTVVTLVDNHDNAGDGSGSCEALYAGTIVVEVGGMLITNGCPVYAREAVIDGDLDGDVIIIGESCQGDSDGDGTVDVLDLLDVISAWGDCEDDCPSDFDANGTVDVIDLLIVIQYWGACEG